ncbi:hypothetical protein C8Q75DRAFT_796662 [Abortiporus biennis]|nr:hypothetical protein C8Q75DRAFT_796662 [Abortiporus biennis]
MLEDSNHSTETLGRSTHRKPGGKLGRWKTVKKLFRSKDKTTVQLNLNDASKSESDILGWSTSGTQVQMDLADSSRNRKAFSSEWAVSSPDASQSITDETAQADTTNGIHCHNVVDPRTTGRSNEDISMMDASSLGPLDAGNQDAYQSTAEGTSVAIKDHYLTDGLGEVAAVLPGEPNADTKDNKAHIASHSEALTDDPVLDNNDLGSVSSTTLQHDVTDVNTQGEAPPGYAESSRDAAPSEQGGADNVHDHTTVTPRGSDAGQTVAPAPDGRALNLDLVYSIRGMYRILDLVNEQGSGGLVDKVVISQESLGQFMNDIVPGSYTSMTKVNFAALDKVSIRPLGIYGSRSEIIKFLHDIEAIDDHIASMLHIDGETTGPSTPTLRSGLYLLHSPTQTILYALYWPEETTWNDDAVSSVRRNRITFMRYLTKIADQVVALISSEHANAIVWNDDNDNAPTGEGDEDESDRLFTFQVAKTHEQEENVTAHAGFSVDLPKDNNTLLDGSSLDPSMFAPRLVNGETSTGYMQIKYVPPENISQNFNHSFNSVYLKQTLGTKSLRLSEELSEEALKIVLPMLEKRSPEPVEILLKQRKEVQEEQDKIREQKTVEMKTRIRKDNNALVRAVRTAITDSILLNFRLTRSRFGVTNKRQRDANNILMYSHVYWFLSPAESLVQSACKDKVFIEINQAPFKQLKDKLLLIHQALQQEPDMPAAEKNDTIKSILSKEQLRSDEDKSFLTNIISKINVKIFWSPSDTSTSTSAVNSTRDNLRALKRLAIQMPDFEFLGLLKETVAKNPEQEELANAAKGALNFTCNHLAGAINKKSHEVSRKIEEIELEFCTGQLDLEYSIRVEEVFKRSLSYQVSGQEETRCNASLKHDISVFQLTEHDKHEMQFNPSHVPTPRILARSSFSFNLPIDHKILLIQLLEDNRCLLVTQSTNGLIEIFLDHHNDLGRAISTGRFKKQFHQEKIGNDLLVTYDEVKRFLAVCAVEKLSLHIFAVDESFKSVDGFGSSVDLRPWYSGGHVKLMQIAFVCGTSEELVLVDENACARIYSLTTQQFRPASLQLLRIPSSVHSSPDGSGLFTVEEDDGIVYLRAYHWSNFGSSEGIYIELPDFKPESVSITSVSRRARVHVVGLDSSSALCKSLALDITRKSTEFTFKEKGSGRSHQTPSNHTKHNCIIDCHADVWTRFPVVPAVRRQTMLTSKHFPKSLQFVSHLTAAPYQAHFSDLIATFERTTRKPTNNELTSIIVKSTTYSLFMKTSVDDVSTLQAGEWLVDILCLIPIHIAITRDNRFIPLKDGVWSNEVERSLLGATIDQIVDGLSFGWYESVFQSYMATKPVRVVSSMGEQSVGKSFALNHLVDTSFAGSAMRTTEGVWMSVTPTNECLIVALDFEGVHSIERSAQEDSLLVLFNTAMSNLVLFRNNFALSRDITGLFQSFQSSSTVLDPAANPTLFQSTLVIIIKDVVDSDKNEITREFSLKFQKIVELEQGSNFITRLHAGNLAIIPWPVIESRQFYTLFPTLKRMLDKQLITHKKAGIFLQTMKTLMAKLKVNDWGSLDQNLASHRAQQLTTLLPRAIAFGATELEPDVEPLKDFDTGLIIEMPDSSARFYVTHGSGSDQVEDKENSLKSLIESWENFATRFDNPEQQWAQDLSDSLDKLVDMRIDHVREWMTINSARFSSDAIQFEAIRRLFDSLVISVKASTRLCRLQCSECQLSCLRIQHHDGPHDCQTSHRCNRLCSFKDDHREPIDPCGLPAGHPSTHICDISAHLCGKPCDLTGKGGCLDRCAKMVNHPDEEHRCPATSHECGEPCSLRNIHLSDGSSYTCYETCRIPSHQPHDVHVCETRSCPLTCQLCKRLCASPDHFHALDGSTSHLCGQAHPCASACQSDGICQIETAPQSVEATFTGTHETFQYTKYTQESKRLPCVIQIPPGELEHLGKHVHNTDKNTFHFCKTRCDYCGYFCTLPLGHTQQEHDTRHGSMSKTRWAVEGPAGSIIEVDGHKFGATDDGAPMLCSMVCRDMGRHIHIDYCRSTDPQTCSGQDLHHVPSMMHPDPHRPKDFITHALYWRRTGFKDPYSQEDRVVFAKCDFMCAGQEHQADTTGPAQPSYCNLPLFHVPLASGQAPPGGVGYVSRDGHHFNCRNPVQMQQAYHVMFVIDRSGSMNERDRRPLANTPVTDRISRYHNNRLGAVYSSLFAFWSARLSANSGNGQAPNRRDAYSIVLFDDAFNVVVNNNFTSTPDELLQQLLQYQARGWTNYDGALKTAQSVMESNWSTERTPVIIFLSDGICNVDNTVVRDLCRRSIALGRPLSFHAVSFGPGNATLRQMSDIALNVQRQAPNDPMHPTIASSYTEALDTIRLAETFLGLADSLQKPRGSLMYHT